MTRYSGAATPVWAVAPYTFPDPEPSNVLSQLCSLNSCPFFKVQNLVHAIYICYLLFIISKTTGLVPDPSFSFGGNHLSLTSSLEASGRVHVSFQSNVGKGARLSQFAYFIFLTSVISSKVHTCPELIQWDEILEFSQNNLSTVPDEPWGCQPRAASGQHRVKAYLRMKPTQRKPLPSVRFLKASLEHLDLAMPEDQSSLPPWLLSFVSQVIPCLARSQTELEFHHLVTIETWII